jgi:hypothetical protein
MLNSEIKIPNYTFGDYIESLDDKKPIELLNLGGAVVAASTVSAIATTAAAMASTGIVMPILAATGMSGAIISKAEILKKLAEENGLKNAKTIYYTEILKNFIGVGCISCSHFQSKSLDNLSVELPIMMSAALSTTYITYLQGISKQSLENSKLFELLKEKGTSNITKEIIDKLEEYIGDTTKPNAIGINSGFKAGLGNIFNGFQSKKYLSDLPNSNLEYIISKNLS